MSSDRAPFQPKERLGRGAEPVRPLVAPLAPRSDLSLTPLLAQARSPQAYQSVCSLRVRRRHRTLTQPFSSCSQALISPTSPLDLSPFYAPLSQVQHGPRSPLPLHLRHRPPLDGPRRRQAAYRLPVRRLALSLLGPREAMGKGWMRMESSLGAAAAGETRARVGLPRSTAGPAGRSAAAAVM